MEVIKIGWGYKTRCFGWFAIPVASIFIRDCYLQYTNFISLNDKESVIVSPVITVHTLRKKGEMKTVSDLTRLPGYLVLWRSLNWLNGCGRENFFWWRLLGGAKIAKVQRKGVLVGIARMVLWISKGGIGRWKLTEVEEHIFVWDCGGGCMHKQDCENEGTPNIL